MVKIVTDSACDLPLQVIKDLDISIVPARILFGRHAYKDGIDITINEFYDRLPLTSIHPNTTQAAPLDYYREFRRLELQQEEIIYIGVSESLSALIRSAREAAKEIHKTRVEIVDSEGVSVYQGLQAVIAGQMAKSGYSTDEILTRLDMHRKNIRLYSIANTLDYLKRGGRISAASYRVGSLLGILPIIKVGDFEVEAIDRQLFGNMGGAMDKIIKLLKAEFSSDTPLTCYILHSQNMTGAVTFADKMTKNFNINELVTTKIGPTIGTNIGPGAIGVAIAPVVAY